VDFRGKHCEEGGKDPSSKKKNVRNLKVTGCTLKTISLGDMGQGKGAVRFRTTNSRMQVEKKKWELFFDKKRGDGRT